MSHQPTPTLPTETNLRDYPAIGLSGLLRIRQGMRCTLYATGHLWLDSNESANMNPTSRFKRIPSTGMAAMGDDPRFMKRLSVRLATTAVVSGGLGLAGLALAGPAAAFDGPHQWCPGQSLTANGGPGPVAWDMNVCHTWYRIGGYATGNVSTTYGVPTDIWDGPNPPAPPPPQCNAPGLPPCSLFP
jgi:hypothetical protein